MTTAFQALLGGHNCRASSVGKGWGLDVGAWSKAIYASKGNLINLHLYVYSPALASRRGLYWTR